MTIRIGVITFPGSNCEAETMRAVERAGADAVRLWYRDTSLSGADVVILPGGFSYGDYLRAGAIARFSPIMQAVAEHARAGGGVIGICNGFQILCEAGLLPGALVRNQGLHYVSRPVAVRVERVDTIVTRSLRRGQVLRIPVGHGEGRYVAPPQVLAQLEAENCVVLRYRNGFLDAPANPNGSARDIAAICNPAGTVVGLMPHPERLADPLLDSDVGEEMFYSIVASLAGNPARPNRDTPHEHGQAQS